MNLNLKNCSVLSPYQYGKNVNLEYNVKITLYIKLDILQLSEVE